MKDAILVCEKNNQINYLRVLTTIAVVLIHICKSEVNNNLIQRKLIPTDMPILLGIILLLVLVFSLSWISTYTIRRISIVRWFL